jgi:putative transposase
MAAAKRLGHAGGMPSEPAAFPGYRFPSEIISSLYHVFGLSFRDVELLLVEWGITISHKSIRQWCLKFGTDFARKLPRRRPKPGDTWHLDEMLLKINGELHNLRRAVDQHGVVLEIRFRAAGTPRQPSASSSACSLGLCTSRSAFVFSLLYQRLYLVS